MDPKLVVKSYSLGLELVIIFGILCAVHRFSKQSYILVPSDLDINDSDMMVLKDYVSTPINLGNSLGAFSSFSFGGKIMLGKCSGLVLLTIGNIAFA